ncbi:class F sortase [Herbiconiux sp. UC225_62]|uniref:class F sortase n=1 Tax=Herbiconiux sp. UC225_62 TaxID=3350168 RepID=UPI0036D3BCD6
MRRLTASARAAPPVVMLAGALLALAGLVAGCAGPGASDGGSSSSQTGDGSASASSPPPDAGSDDDARSDPSIGAAGALQDPQLATPTPDGRNATPPVRVRIPVIGVDSALESLTRDATGWIQAPADFGSAGWYRDGVVPGQLGPAVIAGHIDSAVGPAVFYDLASLSAGDTVQVDLADGSTVAFRVDRSIQVPKNDFPTADVYGPTPDAQLRLVTCGGAFDDASGHYVDNVVVFATKIDG